ncbi:MAG: hypothetical protein LPK85_04425 [Gammaproteobacteria bacterium]|nr:hypothetical protein [Gammaproteobacteria bacterium]
MDIEELKPLLGDKFQALKSFVDDLVGQRDAARSESISGRKGLKSELEKLKAQNATMLEKLGIDSADDLENLPDMKGQADAVKQFESRVKRLEREIADKDKALTDALTNARNGTLSGQLAKLITKHGFIDEEVMTDYLRARVEWEGDSPMFKTEDGKLLPLDEGAALVATRRPHLCKSSGVGGSGYRGEGSGDATPNPWAKSTFNLTEQIRLNAENPQLAATLKTAAAAQ